MWNCDTNLDSDDSLAADLLHGIGNYVTNLHVTICWDCSNLKTKDNIKALSQIQHVQLLIISINSLLINRTCAISSGVVTGFERFFSSLMTVSTAIMTPRRISTGLAPLLMVSKPSLAMARANTVAVVVPSPASSLVLLATSCTSLAPMFLYLSFRSILLATVTPSLVTFGLPQLCSMMTVRPWNRDRKWWGEGLQHWGWWVSLPKEINWSIARPVIFKPYILTVPLGPWWQPQHQPADPLPAAWGHEHQLQTSHPLHMLVWGEEPVPCTQASPASWLWVNGTSLWEE